MRKQRIDREDRVFYCYGLSGSLNEDTTSQNDQNKKISLSLNSSGIGEMSYNSDGDDECDFAMS